MTDVLLFQTQDDGDMRIVDGVTELTGGFETMAYLSLFGGNERDDGSQDSPHQYWGDLDEPDSQLHTRSETQYALDNFSAIPANLPRIEAAARRDLAIFTQRRIASEVTVVASMPGIDRVSLQVSIRAEGEESMFAFTENWKAIR